MTKKITSGQRPHAKWLRPALAFLAFVSHCRESACAAEAQPTSVEATADSEHANKSPRVTPNQHLDDNLFFVFFDSPNGSDWDLIDQHGEKIALPTFMAPGHVPSTDPNKDEQSGTALILSEDLNQTLQNHLPDLEKLIGDAQSFEQYNRFTTYDAETISSFLKAQLQDWGNVSPPSLPYQRIKRLRIVAVAEKPQSFDGPVRCNVVRLLLLFPPMPSDGDLYRSGKGLRVDILNADGSITVSNYWSLSILGDKDFRDRCLSLVYLRRLMDLERGSEHLSLLMQGRISEAEEWNRGIEHDITTVTSQAMLAAFERKAMKNEITEIVGKAFANQAISKIERTAPLFLASVADILGGPNDWFSSLILYKRRGDVVSKSFNPAGMAWLQHRISTIGMVGVDSEKLWIVQGSFAIQLANALCGRVDLARNSGERKHDYEFDALRQEVINAPARRLSRRTFDEIVHAIDAIDTQGWDSTRAGRRLLPPEPNAPRPPSRMRSVIQRESASDALERLSDLQMATGDIEGFFESQAAIGAAAALETGNQQLLSQFSQQDLANARLFGGGIKMGVATEYDYKDPEYLQNKSVYDILMKEWRARCEEMSVKVGNNLERRKELAKKELAAELELFSEFRPEPSSAEQERFADYHMYIPSIYLLATPQSTSDDE